MSLAVAAVIAGVLAAEHAAALDAGQGPATGMGTVTGAEIRRGSRGHRSAWVIFRHGERSSSCMVRLEEADTLRSGQELPYWSHKGLTRRLTLLEPCSRRERREAQRLAAMLGTLSALELAGALLVMRASRRRHRLLTGGAGASGVVTAVRPGVRGLYIVELDLDRPVSFRGTRLVGKRLLRALGGGGIPQAGDTVHVVHDREQPSRFELWGFEKNPTN